MSGPELFHTRARANEGVRLPLYTPDGSPSDHWLQVRHTWSDAFQEANDVAIAQLQDKLLAAAGNAIAVVKAKREAQLRIWSALVCGWSFDTECTPEAVEAWLREAPQIGKVLDTFAADSKRFFGNDSTISTDGSSQNEPLPQDSQTDEA